jgi:hypothetical protein
MSAVKVFSILARRADRSSQYFHDHWRHPHATMGLGIVGARRYVQSHRIDTPLLDTAQSRYDGIVEIWFESLADAFRLQSDPVYRGKLVPDESTFLDMSKGVSLMTTEEVLMSGATSRSDLPEADSGWHEHQRPVSIKLIQLFSAPKETWAREDDVNLGGAVGALRHVRCFPVALAHPQGSALSGIRELWWPTLTAFEEGVAQAKDAWKAMLGRATGTVSLLANAERFP